MKHQIESLETRRLFVVDLMVMNFAITSYNAGNGELKVSAQVTNTGLSAIPAGVFNEVFLSTDQSVNNKDDITIGAISSLQIPSGGTLATIPLTFNIAGEPAGSYYVGVALDSDSAVNEPDDRNNYRFSGSKITVNETFDIVIDGTDEKDSIIATQNTDEVRFFVNTVLTRTIAVERITSLVLRGFGGNDIINTVQVTIPVRVEGGDGKDTITTGIGADTLAGNAGADSITGGGGNDLIRGHGGNDVLFGESGADRLFGDAGNDRIDGGSSNDRIDGGTGGDIMYGQGGDDRFIAKDGTVDLLYGGSGADTATRDSSDLLQSVLA